MLESLLIVEYMFTSYKLLGFSEWLKVVKFLFMKLEKHIYFLAMSSYKLASKGISNYITPNKNRKAGPHESL